MQIILVTGCAGFIGSNFVLYFLEKYPYSTIVNLDLLTYTGDSKSLKEVENHVRYKFIKGDICNHEMVEFIFNQYDIRGVIHFAAEGYVDNFITPPLVSLSKSMSTELIPLLMWPKTTGWKIPFTIKKNMEPGVQPRQMQYHAFTISLSMKSRGSSVMIQKIYLQRQHPMYQTLPIVYPKRAVI